MGAMLVYEDVVSNSADSNKINITQGDAFSGVLELRQNQNGVINLYPIPVGASVAIHFPAFDTITPAPVVLTTTDNEVTIEDPLLSTISFVGSVAKSLLLNPGKMQKIDVVITTTGGDSFTLTSDAIVNIAKRANP